MKPSFSFPGFVQRKLHSLRDFAAEHHPIVHSILLGTILARAASSMSMPFLALYLSNHTDMSTMTIGAVIGAGPLAGTIGGFFGGALSDRFGRKRVMMAALYVWGLMFIGFGLATATWMFLALNVLNGLCRSFYEPVSQALMADLTPKEKRFRVFSLRYTCINIGVAVGPLLGAWFGMMSGRLPFLITGGIYLIYAAVLLMLLNRFGISRIEGEKKEQVTVGSAWNVIRRDVVLRWYLAGGILASIGYSQMGPSLSQYIDDKGLNGGIGLFSILMSVNAVVVIVCQVPITRFIERRTPLVAITVGSVMYALGNLGYALADGRVLFILAMVVFTFGEILTFPSTNLLIDSLAPSNLRGTYYGAQSFSNLGHSIGPWLGGIMLSVWNGSVLFGVIAALSLTVPALYGAGNARLERLRLASGLAGQGKESETAAI
ncbi:MDR family MFS transporter [Gorillibacterium sp. sgz5001074]|uniref:MDR family MFS transporter n=1 Tax=Gorillibacterium sp. sgz5001074 TaxID=3446695 RepID=UPI003F670025